MYIGWSKIFISLKFLWSIAVRSPIGGGGQTQRTKRRTNGRTKRRISSSARPSLRWSLILMGGISETNTSWRNVYSPRPGWINIISLLKLCTPRRIEAVLNIKFYRNQFRSVRTAFILNCMQFSGYRLIIGLPMLKCGVVLTANCLCADILVS